MSMNFKIGQDFDSWWNEKKLGDCFSRAFYLILLLKIGLIVITLPPIMERLFVPFISWFVEHPFENPYDYFYHNGPLDSFPYSSLMLWVYSLPSLIARELLPQSWSSGAAYVWPRLAIICGDIAAYVALCAFLPVQKKRVTLYWWMNPLVGYVCYVHGQLDVLPTVALLVAIHLLFGRRDILAMAALGIGISMKSHLLAALPFFALFIAFRSFSRVKPIIIALVAVLIYIALQMPYWGPGYFQLVLLEKKSLGLFKLSFPFDESGRAFLFAPAAVMVVLFRYAFHQTTNRDTLLLTLGLVYGAMVGVVPPSPGWFIWCMPFLVYFFVKYREAPRSLIWAFVGSYLVYQLVDRNSDIPSAFAPIYHNLKSAPNLFQNFHDRGMDASMIENIAFTAMETSLVLTVFWMYRLGVSSSNLARRLKQNFRIGVCGDSGSGKSTVAKLLLSLFGERNTLVVAGDDLHKWERGDVNWSSQTHLNPKSNRLNVDVAHAERLMAGRNIKRSYYDHGTGKFTEQHAVESRSFILFQGLHTFFLPRMRNLLHLKVFMDPDKSLRYFWKIKRDMAKRGYTKDQVMAQLAQREADSQKFIESQKPHADLIVRYLPEIEGMTVDAMLAADTVPIKMQLIIHADMEAEELQEAIMSSSQMACNYWYESSNNWIIFECQGRLTEHETERAAAKLSSLYQELTDSTPKFSSDYDGVLQLVVLLYLKQFYLKGASIL